MRRDGKKQGFAGNLHTYVDPTWTGAGDLVLDDGAVFTNQVGAGFDVQNDRIMLTNRGQPGTFVNAGSLRKFSAGTTTGPGALVFANTGSVDVQAGTLSAAGYYTQTAGSTIVRGTPRAAGFVEVRGGALSGTGTVDGPAAGVKYDQLKVNGTVTLGGTVLP
jgi:hypothetical protein